MPKRLINEGVLVVRNGRRVRPEIGKLFDLTTDEIAQLEAVRPSAIGKLPTAEVDSASVDLDGDGEKDVDTGKDADTGKTGKDADTGKTAKAAAGTGRKAAKAANTGADDL